MTQDYPVFPKLSLLLLGALLAGQGLAAPGQPALGDPQTRVLDVSQMTGLKGLAPKLADRRVVFVGENHDRYEDHLNELAIVRAMYAQDPNMAIGLEFFQQPFQKYLDRYVAGELDEAGMLRGTQYFERWRYDYRLYRPILHFARKHHVPLVALNVPRELTERVVKVGLEGLTPQERKGVPARIDRSDAAYRERIHKVFEQHPGALRRSFVHFLDAQLLWDEGMAKRAADYLRAHPGRRMAVLAGSGHLVYRQGIPNRLLRRLPATSAVVLNAANMEPEPGLADFLLYPRRMDLPRGGLMGVVLDTGKGTVSIKGFAHGSPAKATGLKEGDRIERLAGVAVSSYTDIRLALLDRSPGEQVDVQVLRPEFLVGDKHLDFKVRLY